MQLYSRSSSPKSAHCIATNIGEFGHDDISVSTPEQKYIRDRPQESLGSVDGGPDMLF